MSFWEDFVCFVIKLISSRMKADSVWPGASALNVCMESCNDYGKRDWGRRSPDSVLEAPCKIQMHSSGLTTGQLPGVQHLERGSSPASQRGSSWALDCKHMSPFLRPSLCQHSFLHECSVAAVAAAKKAQFQPCHSPKRSSFGFTVTPKHTAS